MIGALCLCVPRADAPGAPPGEEGSSSRSAPLIDEIYASFKNPPRGYGEVAFYWWLGDTLTRDRLGWQLDQLAGKGVTGLQVNYAHTDSGGLLWGLSKPSQPRLFTEEWWELFGWFMQEAKKRGMAVSLSDYTLGVGQGSYVDDALAAHPEVNGYELRYEKRFATGTSAMTWELPAEPLALCAYRAGRDSLPVPGTRLDLSHHVSRGELRWTPDAGSWVVSCVWAERIVPSYDPMHPLSGRAYIDNFFGRFERRFPGEAGSGLNYFFSDELWFRLRYPMWNEVFTSEFRRRKGYDVRPHLPSLFVNTGSETVKIRLDYNDVMVSLSEEFFFRPLYQWHEDRGMTFGCDHGGRGKEVAEFGDYFRTQRWNQGPGCDQPFLQQDIIKNKVASSIAHLYQRPRVWLEASHSSGWGTSSADLARATFGNFVMGQNLLTLHGLYYSTHGGWWEWAPPCNHFRMPYWQHIDPFMHAVQRLSNLLSQGVHRADVAVLYPVEPVVAGMGGQEAVTAAFAVGETLYNAGIDFDFIDYESLARSTIRSGTIAVSGEQYRVLVIPSTKVIRLPSLARARDLVASGGVVVNIGTVPEVCEKGAGDSGFDSLRSDLFGDFEVLPTGLGLLRSNSRGGAVYQCGQTDSLLDLVSRLFTRDFEVIAYPENAPKTPPRVMHRHIAGHEIYVVYNLPAGTECFFRSKGAAEVWDPWTGGRRPLTMVRRVDRGTILQMPMSQYDVQVIVFGPGEHQTFVEATTLAAVDSVSMVEGRLMLWGANATPGPAEATVRRGGTTYRLVGDAPSGRVIKPLAGEWDFEVQPVLDNRWGDFHWPPTPELIGPEVRRFAYSQASTRSGRLLEPSRRKSPDTVSCSYGAQFWKLGPLPGIIPDSLLSPGPEFEPEDQVTFKGKKYAWQPYQFSWRWGVEGDPGHQGYHGLKEQVHDEFIRLGKLTEDWTTTRREREEGGSWYCLFTGVNAPAEGMYSIEQGDVRPAAIQINGVAVDTAAESVRLRAGLNTLLLWHDRPCVTYFVLRDMAASAGPAGLRNQTTPGKPLAMSWYGDRTILPFDTRFREEAPEGRYTFLSAPGMKSMRFAAHGAVQVSVDGMQVRLAKGDVRDDGAVEYTVDLDSLTLRAVEVAINIRQKRGFYGGAAIPDPIRLECGRGKMEIGDWSRNDALYAYSGGARYRRAVHLSADEVNRKVELDLGAVVSTAEVWVNGVNVGVRISPPWVYDISTSVRAGENSIEVLVYNTAANHYTSIPTRYRGPVRSGILGPVRISLTGRAMLTEE